MIDLYYWPTPNGHKITLFLEEAGLQYTLKPVNIGKGEQFEPAFLQISPNNKMPAIVDHAPADGGGAQSVFESGAILLYLAEKTGRFLPRDARGRIAALEWLFWQMGGLGPMSGQMGHFNVYAPERLRTRSSATTPRCVACMACSTSAWPTTPSWPATTTALPTWPAIRGSKSMATSNPTTPPSPSEALARRHRRAPGDPARLRAQGAGQSQCGPAAQR